jgi:hypothetical protein
MKVRSTSSRAARTAVSAEQISALIQESTAVIPSLQNVKVRLVRLPRPDADGCNWVAKPSPLPTDHPPAVPGLLYGVIADIRRQFNLSDSPG